MGTRQRLITLIAAGAVVLGATGYALWPAADAGTAGPPAHAGRRAPGEVPVVVLAADQHGVILLDKVGQVYQGFRRDGSLAWTDAAAALAGATATCLATCPDAVISSNVDSLNDPRVPDPAPYAVTGAQRRALAGVTGHKRRVLAATGLDDMVVAGGDGDGAWWLETRTTGRPARRFPVSGPDVSWTTTPDGRHALAVSAARGAREGRARWFTRTPAGWARAGTATTVPGTAGCVAPDGSRALVFGFGQPTLLDRSGRARPVTDLVHGGACAWSTELGLVAELAFDLGGARRSRLRAVDRTGAVVWSRDLPVEVRPFADPSGPAVGYVANGTLHELDLTRGQRTAAVSGVRAARYDGHGSLVTVGDAGTVQWRPAAPAS